MRRLEVSPEAQADLDDLLEWSEDQFGAIIADRYRLLIDTALAEVIADPDRNQTRPRSNYPAGFRYHHLRFSRTHVPSASRIGEPRHVLVYRFDELRIELVRVLHERRDFPGQLVSED